ncbi:MAG: ABC transporter permease [Rhodobacteraceae bacterium]|nr:ABC transporter permease [Paracoccaceae bacterium]
MTSSAPNNLKSKLARANRRKQFLAASLVAPLAVFLLVAFFFPLGKMLFLSVENTDVQRHMPQTSEAITTWDGQGIPDETVYAALVDDLRIGSENRTIALAATSLNHEIAGFRSLVMSAARRSDDLTPPFQQSLIDHNAKWGEHETWVGFQRAAAPYTLRYLLASVDLKRDVDGEIQKVPESRRVYISYLKRTLWICFVVTALCLALGFPMSYLIANASPRARSILFILVLLPFWTSLLVRTTAWVILLQSTGIVNSMLMWVGLTDGPIQLIFNRFGVYVSMVHILLPFMILPIYSVMRSIPKNHLHASASLGARPFATFRYVYLPRALPGVTAGCMLVSVLALGFYITPALVGGAGDQMLSFLIAEFTIRTANWHMAAALALLLLLTIIVVFSITSRLIRPSRGNRS